MMLCSETPWPSLSIWGPCQHHVFASASSEALTQMVVACVVSYFIFFMGSNTKKLWEIP